jgi:hypothetical protein
VVKRALTAAVAALAVVVAYPALAAQPRRASLELESLAPLQVSGRDFGPREAVRLRYEAADGAGRTRTVQATRLGRLHAAFPVRVGRCVSFTVRAAGTAGSRAVLQVERSCEKAKAAPEQAPREKPKPPKG